VNTANQPLVLGKTVLSWHLFPRKPLTLRLFELEYSNSYHLSKETRSIVENDSCVIPSCNIYVEVVAHCNQVVG
jgi:hypothetical protein